MMQEKKNEELRLQIELIKLQRNEGTVICVAICIQLLSTCELCMSLLTGNTCRQPVQCSNDLINAAQTEND